MFHLFENPMETEIEKLLEKEGYNVEICIDQNDTFNNDQYEIRVSQLNIENQNDFIFYVKKILHAYEKENNITFVDKSIM